MQLFSLDGQFLALGENYVVEISSKTQSLSWHDRDLSKRFSGKKFHCVCHHHFLSLSMNLELFY